MPTALSIPRQPSRPQLHDGADQVGAALRRHLAVLADVDPAHLLGVHDQLVEALVHHDQVRAAAEDAVRHVELAAERERLPQLLRRAREGHDRGRTADAHGRVAGQGLALAERASPAFVAGPRSCVGPCASSRPPPQQLVPRRPHAPRAERQHHVALARLGREPLGGRLQVARRTRPGGARARRSPARAPRR